MSGHPTSAEPIRGICRICGCTDIDCRGCIARTGAACKWTDGTHTLCSACVAKGGNVKRDRLFYFEETCNNWVPVPFSGEEIPGIVSAEDLAAGEVRAIKVKVVKMTDAEFANLPEAQ